MMTLLERLQLYVTKIFLAGWAWCWLIPFIAAAELECNAIILKINFTEGQNFNEDKPMRKEARDYSIQFSPLFFISKALNPNKKVMIIVQ